MKATPKDIDKLLKEAGYKFLGWQNGWQHVYVDKDGNVTNDKEKYIGATYMPDKYPEFCACRDANHKQDEIQHNQRGSENTVSCDICKIYWKYDCSD